MKIYKYFFYILYHFVRRFEKLTPEWGAIFILSTLALLNFASALLVIYKNFDLPIISKISYLIIAIGIVFVHQHAFITEKKYKKINRQIERSLDKKKRSEITGYLFLYVVGTIVILFGFARNY